MSGRLDAQHRVDAGLRACQFGERLNVLDRDAECFGVVGAEVSLQHQIEHEMQIRADDREDRFAFQMIEILDRRTRRHLQRKFDPTARDGDRNGRSGKGEITYRRRRSEHADVELTGRKSLEHPQQHGKIQIFGVDAQVQLGGRLLEELLALQSEHERCAVVGESHADGHLQSLCEGGARQEQRQSKD